MLASSGAGVGEKRGESSPEPYPLPSSSSSLVDEEEAGGGGMDAYLIGARELDHNSCRCRRRRRGRKEPPPSKGRGQGTAWSAEHWIRWLPPCSHADLGFQKVFYSFLVLLLWSYWFFFFIPFKSMVKIKQECTCFPPIIQLPSSNVAKDVIENPIVLFNKEPYRVTNRAPTMVFLESFGKIFCFLKFPVKLF